MELLIKDKVVEQLRNCYQIEVEFMFGDADGYETLDFVFPEERYKDPKFKELTHDFIRSIQSCITLDSHGRCGFDSGSEAFDWYHLGVDRCGDSYNPPYQWRRFCECYYDGEEDLPEYEDNDFFIYSIPCNEGWYASYEYINVWYYDNDGYKYSVEIKND